jgi:hypothetical protein
MAVALVIPDTGDRARGQRIDLIEALNAEQDQRG